MAGNSTTKNLNDGSATVALPRRLNAGENYNVRARYVPKQCSRFQGSGDTDTLRVVKVDSRARVDVRNIERGDRPRARVLVTTRTGVNAKTFAKVRIRQGAVAYTKRVDLNNNGAGSVRFKALNRLGKWNVKVTYPGTQNIKQDTGTDTFRVTRN